MPSSLLASLLALALLAPAARSFVLPERLPLLTTKDNDDDDLPNPLPLVIWHGLGDNFQAEGLRSVGDLAEEINPGTYVHYVHLADTGSSDRTATFFGNVTEQIAQVCEQLAADPILSTAPAINALGFSQGGQFLRGYVERCNSPPVANLVTFGSQHNGIATFQECGATDWLCKAAQGLLRGNTWSEYVQARFVPAQYFRHPEELDSYLESSNFLADVNNERETKNSTYAANMRRLQRFVMFVFEDDTTVVPKQSGWFSEVNATDGTETKLQDRPLYKEDWLGLKWLDRKGRLVFKSIPGGHMQISKETLVEVFTEYFSLPSKEEKSKDTSVWESWSAGWGWSKETMEL